MNQTELDAANAEYWNEVCGTHLARRTKTENDFEAFDREYFKLYPFLLPMLDKFSGSVLEFGTGYGSVARYLAQREIDYLGCDIAKEPIRILLDSGLRARFMNVLETDFYPNKWDGVVSIGCLHHTGNIPRALSEIHRVLKPGGRALIMLYNANAEKLAVDRNTKGERAPHIEYTDVKDIPTLFAGWSSWEVSTHNGTYKDIYIEAVK